MQSSLKEAAANTVYDTGTDASLDSIIKKFTISCGNVKTFDLIIRNFIWFIRKNPFHHLPTGQIVYHLEWQESPLKKYHPMKNRGYSEIGFCIEAERVLDTVLNIVMLRLK